MTGMKFKKVENDFKHYYFLDVKKTVSEAGYYIVTSNLSETVLSNRHDDKEGNHGPRSAD